MSEMVVASFAVSPGSPYARQDVQFTDLSTGSPTLWHYDFGDGDTLDGVQHPGVMIRSPMLETQLTPAAWAYQIGFVQETRR